MTIRIYKGKKYKSLKHLTQEKAVESITSHIVSGRLLSGWSLEDALKIPKTRDDKKGIYSVDGKKYESLKALALDYALKYSTVLGRKRRGYSDKEIAHGPLTKQGKKIVFNGKTFNTRKALCDAYGVKYDNFKQRVHSGWSLKEALEIVKRKNTKEKKQFYKGKEYPSFKTLCQAYNKPDYIVRSRLKRGWELKDALEGNKPRVDNRARRVVGSDKTYQSIKAAAEAHGIKPATLSDRLRRGVPIEEALEIAPIKTKSNNYHKGNPRGVVGTKITVNGVTYKSIRKCACAFGINHETLAHRLKRGLKPEEAVSTNNYNSKSIKIEGETFASIAEASRHYDVDEKLVGHRLRAGFTERQAVGLDNPPPHGKRKPILVNDMLFETIADAARYYKLDVKMVWKRLRDGKTVEQALGIEPLSPAIEVDGNIFTTLREAASAYGVNKDKVGKRLISGWTLEEALNIADRKKPAINRGGINANLFSKNPELKECPSKIYLVHFTSKMTGENFHKIGITTRTLKSRFGGSVGSNYKYKEIASIDLPLYIAWKLEQKLLKEFSQSQYIINDPLFTGRKECFRFNKTELKHVKRLFEESRVKKQH